MAKLNQDGEEEREEENDMTPSRTCADTPAEDYEDDENEQEEEQEQEHEQEEEHEEDADGVVMHYFEIAVAFLLRSLMLLEIADKCGHEYIVNANNLDVSAEFVLVSLRFFFGVITDWSMEFISISLSKFLSVHVGI